MWPSDRWRPTAAVAALALLAACSDDSGPDPKQQFEELARLLRDGEIVALYQAALPASYRDDLDSVLRDVPRLIEEADYERGSEIVENLGRQIAGMISTTPLGEEEAWRLVAEKLADLPALVGLGTWQDFRDVRAERILRAIEDGVARQLLGTEALRGSLEQVTVELIDRKRDWARLKITAAAGGSDDESARSEIFDVVRVGDHWVRDEWVVDWPKVMESGRSSIRTLLELKERDPAAYRAELDAALGRASRPGFLVEDILPRIGQRLLGGAGGASPNTR